MARRPKFTEMPTIQVSPSLFCNLRCSYCPVQQSRLRTRADDFLLSAEFQEKTAGLKGVHFNLNGGEPLLHGAGLKWLFRAAEENGHVISFNTNIAIPIKQLARIFDGTTPDRIGNVGVCHHLWSGVDADSLIENILFLRDRGFDVNVKYLAIPEDFDQISRFLDFWAGEGIENAVSVFIGTWKGRVFPDEYTAEELQYILPKTGSIALGLQFLGPLECNGLSCRAGNDFIFWNSSGDGDILRCCQLTKREMQWEDSYFATGIKKDRACPGTLCWTANTISAVSKVIDDFCENPHSTKRPSVQELAKVARKIEAKTGRRFLNWPDFMERNVAEAGWGGTGQHHSPVSKREVFSLSAGELLPGLEVRSFGGAPALSVHNDCVTMRTHSATDSLRTGYFDILATGEGRRDMIISFESVDLSLGAFSWRVVLQNVLLETLTKRTIKREPDGNSNVTISLPVSFWGRGGSIRLIFAPVGEVGTIFTLGKSLRVYDCQ